MDFSLSSYFNSFDADKEYGIEGDNVEARIENITSALAQNPDVVATNDELLEDIIDLTHGFLKLDQNHQKQLAYLIPSSMGAVAQHIHHSIEAGDFVDSVDHFKAVLERYGYLTYVLLVYLSKEDYALGKSKNNAKWKANCVQVEDALVAINEVLKIKLQLVFVTTPEKNAFLELFMRPTFRLTEMPERVKVALIRMYIFKNVALAAKNHGIGTIIKSSIIQALTYYVHLSPFMAELLNVVSTQYGYSNLTEEVLREIAQLEFNSNDTNGPKSVSEFLVRLSEHNPRLILKQMSSFVQLLDNSNQALRCSVVETCGNIVVDIIKSEGLDDANEHSSNTAQQINSLLNLLQERVLDQNPYVRTKAFQAMIKVCSLPVKIPQRRLQMMKLAVRSLDDKSTLVRRNAVKLMCKLILSHPFSTAHGTQLKYDFWKEKLDEAEAELEKLLPVQVKKTEKEEEDEEDMDVDRDEKDDDANDDDDDIDGHDSFEQSILEGAIPDTNVLVKAKLTVQYYLDAVEFIEVVQQGTDVASRLLFSKNRNEVLESMDFLVLADAYGIQNAGEGIRKMLHLVWMKGSSDEGKSIAAHLIDCYKDLFLTAPSGSSTTQAAALIAKNLIGLTDEASIADLASLEKLLCLMYDDNLINHEIINVLWQIYGFAENNSTDRRQSHGAIMLLGMLALADHHIVVKGLDMILKIGLGEVGQADLPLCKYSCLALQRVVPVKVTTNYAIPREDDTIASLKTLLLGYNGSPEWYTVAEQAIGAVYKISARPDEICSDIIKQKTRLVFGEQRPGELEIASLSQLLFVVGHVAIKTIVHLEQLENQFKKKKHAAEGSKKKDADDNELEMIGGTSEDDFTDAVIYIKERELLYGEGALLGRFGPLVKEVCSNNKNYDNEVLQRSAVLCMTKLMCVSSKYCEDNLPLLITIMEKSPDPIIRCNCVLGLGDMAVCFNNLVDENTDFLYRRLTDDNIMVQRTCLMTVTFLILAGQVKVKGQLSSMAKCLENEDQGISDMCKLFFTELATKDNAIYNGFIDIFSGLSNDKSLSKDAMKRIVKFLVGFVEKEKHQKQLADKLMVRLGKTQTEAEWNDVAFVLLTIPFKNEAITQALEGGFKLVSARQ